MALALHAVQQSVYFLIGQGIGAAELGVEIPAVLGHMGQGVVNLVVIGDRVWADVF